MDVTTVLALATILQTIALAWIAAWQARGARALKMVNGSVAELLEAQNARLETVANELVESPPRRLPE